MNDREHGYIRGEDRVLALYHAVLVLVLQYMLRLRTAVEPYARLFDLVVHEAWTHHRLRQHAHALLHVSTKRVHGVEDAVSSASCDDICSNILQAPIRHQHQQREYFTMASLDVCSVDLKAIFSIIYAQPCSFSGRNRTAPNSPCSSILPDPTNTPMELTYTVIVCARRSPFHRFLSWQP